MSEPSIEQMLDELSGGDSRLHLGLRNFVNLLTDSALFIGKLVAGAEHSDFAEAGVATLLKAIPIDGLAHLMEMAAEEIRRRNDACPEDPDSTEELATKIKQATLKQYGGTNAQR